MNISDYIEKIRSKPVRQRERMAVIATGVSFAIIFLIWIFSFGEMNRSVQTENENQSMQQMEDLKNNFSNGKASIEEMFQELPSQQNLNNAQPPALRAPEENTSDNNENTESAPGSENNKQDSIQNKDIPQLP